METIMYRAAGSKTSLQPQKHHSSRSYMAVQSSAGLKPHPSPSTLFNPVKPRVSCLQRRQSLVGRQLVCSKWMQPPLGWGKWKKNDTKVETKTSNASKVGNHKPWIGRGPEQEKVKKVDLGYRRDLKERIEFAPGDEATLGLGSYGVVKKVLDKETGQEYALKSVPKTPRSAKEAKDMERYIAKLENEVKVMQHIGPSLNVVYLYDVFEDDTHVHLLMEICRGGELWKRIKEGKYSEAAAAGMMRSVLRVVAQCHTKNVIHRDIKPDNFLFLADEADAALKATDFGLATYFTKGEVLKRRCGTPSYLAPEVVQRSYGPEADCWSAGVTAYQLLSGQLPFVDTVNKRPQVREVLRAVVEDPIELDNDFWTTQISPGARDFVAKLLTRDPKERLTAREALQHPWIKEGGNASEEPLERSIVQRLQRFGTFAPLKRAVLACIARRLLATDERLVQERELRHIYESFDSRAEGRLEVDELQAGLERAGYEISKAETMQLITGMDLDGNGRIEYDEFVTALIDWGNLPLNQERFKEEVFKVFQDMDQDNNGLIDREEMAAMVCTCHDTDEMCTAIVDRCMDLADLDGNGLIDRDEFYRLLQTDEADDLAQYEARLRMQEKEMEKEAQA